MSYEKLSEGILNNADNEEMGKENADNNPGSRGFLSRFLDALSSVFTPLLPVIVSAGLLKGILALLIGFGWVSHNNESYLIMNALSGGVFYFLPILIAYSSAKYFGSNPYIGAAVGAAVLYPDLTALLENGNSLSFFGLPVAPVSYASSVLPIFLTVWLLSYIEKFLHKHVHQSIRPLAVPILALFIAVPLFLIVIGPLGYTLGSWVSSAVAFLFDHAAPLAGLFLGGTFSILMIMGMHYALLPVMMLNLAENGFDYLTLIWLAANFAQGAAAIAVFWMTKNKSCKPVFLASGILALLGGPEPAIYGVNLRFRKPFLAGMIGSAIAGLFLTVFQIKSYSIYSGPEWLPVFLGDADVYGILGLLLAFVVPFAVLYFIKFEDSPLVTE